MKTLWTWLFFWTTTALLLALPVGYVLRKYNATQQDYLIALGGGAAIILIVWSWVGQIIQDGQRERARREALDSLKKFRDRLEQQEIVWKREGLEGVLKSLDTQKKPSKRKGDEQ